MVDTNEMFTEKFKLNAHITKEEMSQINNIHFHLKSINQADRNNKDRRYE